MNSHRTGDVRGMYREIQSITGDERGLQGVTVANSGTQWMCTVADMG